MYCPKCGRELPADGSPCVCGAEEEQKTETAIHAENIGEPGGKETPAFPAPVNVPHVDLRVRPRTPAQDAFSALSASPLVLAAAILMTLSLVSSVLASVLHPVDFSRMLPAGDLVARLMTVRFNTPVLSLIGAIPSLLTLIGVWMVFASGKKKSGMPGVGGLALLRVLAIVSVVGLSVLGLLALAAAVFLSGAFFQYAEQIEWAALASMGPDAMLAQFGGEADETLLFALVAVLAAACVIACAWMILIETRVLSSLTAARRLAVSGVARRKASVLLAVVCILRCVADLIDLYGQVTLNGPLGAAAAGCSALASLCFAIMIFKFNGAVKRLRPKEVPRRA